MAVIDDPKMKSFIESEIGNSFDLSVETVAKKAKSWGRFSAWLNEDVSQIKEVLQAVKSKGVSPAFFASYEKSEGYNPQWGWLNHTSVAGDPIEDAKSVSDWIVTQSKNTNDNPAWIDYANYNDFVPESVKQEGNEHFSSLDTGTIGRVVIAGTAAATWAVYYPKGLLAEYNGVQDYADPISVMYETIEEWGGDLDSEGGDNGNGDGGDGGDDGDGGNGGIDFSAILHFFQGFGEDIVKKVEDMLTINLYDYSNSKTFGNNFFKVDKNFSNIYKIKPTINFKEVVNDLIENAMDQLGDLIGGITPPENGGGDGGDGGDNGDGGKDGDMFFPVDYNANGINFWKKENQSKGTTAYDQCYGVRSNGNFHSGYDIGSGGNAGNKVYAIRKCKITDIRQVTGGGYAVFMEHLTDDYHSMFLHLVQDSAVVSKGDTVEAGDQIAVMGDTGGNYAIHLHVEISPSGEFHTKENTINPEDYLKVDGDNSTKLKNPV